MDLWSLVSEDEGISEVWWLQQDLGDSLGLLGVMEAAGPANLIETRYTHGLSQPTELNRLGMEDIIEFTKFSPVLPRTWCTICLTTSAPLYMTYFLPFRIWSMICKALLYYSLTFDLKEFAYILPYFCLIPDFRSFLIYKALFLYLKTVFSHNLEPSLPRSNSCTVTGHISRETRSE